MSNRRILLHMGTHKTGSTSMQAAFARNRDLLRSHGLLYLGTEQAYPNLYSAFLDDPVAEDWNRVQGLDEAQVRARDAQVRDDLAAALEGAAEPNVMISSEYLSMLSRGEMERLRDFLAPHGRVQAVYFYRELISWMASDSQEMAKVGLRARPVLFATAMKRIIDFPLLIDAVFGPAVTFIKFEEAVAAGISNTFLTTFGLPTLDTLGVTEPRLNEGISDNATRALFLYNRLHPVGSATRDPETVARLAALPGEKYRITGFKPGQIEVYARRRAEVQAKLGLRLTPPEQMPRSPHLDPLAEEIFAMLQEVSRGETVLG